MSSYDPYEGYGLEYANMLDTNRPKKLDPDKPLLIILEGGDKVGKSTIYQALRRATHYGPLVIDRFTGSNIVYDTLYGRDTDQTKYADIEGNMNEVFNVVLIVLVASTETQQKRIDSLEKGIDREKALSSYIAVTKLFRDYALNSQYKFKYTLDTTDIDVEGCVDIILYELEVLGYGE